MGDRAHVIHADRGDGLETRVDLGRADKEAAAAADADATDALAVDESPRAQEIDSGAECLRIKIGRNRVARLTVALAPEGQIDGHRHETLLGHLRRVQVGALLLHRAHGVSDDDRRSPGAAVERLGREEVASNLHPVLGLEGDLLQVNLVAGVKIVCNVRHVLSLREWNVDE